MSDPLEYAAKHNERFCDELFEFLRIPSVSAKPEHDGDTREAAEWISKQMEGAGLTSQVFETSGHPVVIGEWRKAGPDAPTLLIYGHYDVQPAEPLELWDTPAFEPTIRDGRIYARGSADDKGQIFLHVKALEAYLATKGTLPVNVIVMAEGEEEVGSPSLVPFIKEHRELLAADHVLISDSAMYAPGQPSLLLSLRGLAYFEIHVTGPTGDLHSGAYGGAIRNPANALAKIIGDLHDEDGRITVDGFYQDVAEWDDETLAAIRSLPFDPARFQEEAGVDPFGGELGVHPLERIWLRPTCDVNGLLSGYTGDGAKTVLPSKAMAKVSFRLVPNQTPDEVSRLFREHLKRVTPDGITIELVELHGGRPWKAKIGGSVFEAASRALEQSFGAKPVLASEGGSIPIVIDFEELLDANALLLGFALPGANMHAPNEWLDVECFNKGIDTLIRFYDELGLLGSSI